MWVTYTVRSKACNEVGDLSVSATPDPILASTLAESSVHYRGCSDGGCRAHSVLGCGLERRTVVTGYVCTGASVSVFTGEVFLIGHLVAGHAYSFQCAALAAAGFSLHVTDGNCQGATTAAGLLFISPQVQTVVVEVASIPSNASFASTTFDCVWRLDSTVGRCFT